MEKRNRTKRLWDYVRERRSFHELAVQASNGIYSASDKELIQMDNSTLESLGIIRDTDYGKALTDKNRDDI